MPAIPFRNAQAGLPSGIQFGRESAPTIGAQIAEGAREAMAILDEQDRKDAAIEGQRLLSDFQIGYMQRQEEMRAKATDPDGFTKSALAEFDTSAQKLLADVKNPLMMDYLKAQLPSVRQGAAGDALRWETGARETRRAIRLQEVFDKTANQVATRPDLFGQVMGNFDAMVAAAGLPVDKADRLSFEGRKLIAKSAINGEIEANPSMALQKLTTGAWDKYVDADYKAVAINSAQVAVRQIEADAKSITGNQRQEFLSGFGAAVETLKRGGSPRTPVVRPSVPAAAPPAARSGGAPGPQAAVQPETITGAPAGSYQVGTIDDAFGPAAIDRFVAAGVLTAAEGAERKAEYYQAMGVWEAKKEVDGMTLPELSGMIADASKPPAEVGPGTEAMLKARAEKAQIAVQRIREFNDDPAAAVQAAGAVRTAREAAVSANTASAPAATQAYLRAVMNEQKRVGVPEAMIKPLPVSEAKALAARLASLPPTELTRTVMTQAQLYGKEWPKVYRQIAKDLPPSVSAILAAPSVEVAEELAAAGQEPEDQKRKALPKDVAKELGDALDADEDIRALDRDLRQRNDPTLTPAAMRKAIELLAMDKVLKRGEGASEAVSSAVKSFIRGKYDFGEVNGRKFRVPRNVNAREVESGAALFQQRLTPDGLDLPASDVARGVTAQAYVSAIKRNGYWVTAGDKGVVLYDPQGRPVRRGGKEVWLPWADAAKTVAPIIQPVKPDGAPRKLTDRERRLLELNPADRAREMGQ